MTSNNGHGPGKSALVLAGGGVTGAVYEIGALRAIDDLLVDRSVNDFDMFVGTSAGALVAALLANGISPQAMMQTFEGTHPQMREIERRDILGVSRADLLRWGARVPRRLLEIARWYGRHPNELNLFDLAWSLVEVMPPGIYDMMRLEGYVRELLTLPGYTNNFRELKRDLHIIATDLDTGDRVAFGKDIHDADAPISLAVAASSAVPLLYQPVRLGDRMLIDGGIRGTASLDLAIEHGATLVVCINPLVPYDNSRVAPGSFFDTEGRYVDKKGMQAIASQVSRISTHAGLHYHVKQMRRLHPEVDIIVIEPRADDCQMFYYNIMHYAVRLLLAKHGFESVTIDLAEDYPHYKEILSRHGIPISRRLVIEELSEIQKSGYDPAVIREVLEARLPSCERNAESIVCRLDKALAELDVALDGMAEEASAQPA